MLYVDILTHLFIVILLMRLLCVLMTWLYNPLLITSILFLNVLTLVVFTVSAVPTSSVLYHYPIRFSSNLHSFITITPPSSLSGLVVPPTNEFWLSFDSVVNYFGSHLLSWPGSNVTHFMLETNLLYFRIATFFNSRSSIQFTSLPHFFHHLHRFHHCNLLNSVLNPRIKP